MISLIIWFVVGYGAGWAIRQGMKHFQTSRGACNIGKRGISGRAGLAVGLVIFGFFFESPIILLCAGFTWYESRAKWCIVESFTEK